ncbi:MAG: hypothetical protein ACLUGB_03090 [Bacilli bacterium]
MLKIIAGQESIDSGSLSIRNNISIGYLSQIPEKKRYNSKRLYK